MSIDWQHAPEQCTHQPVGPLVGELVALPIQLPELDTLGVEHTALHSLSKDTEEGMNSQINQWVTKAH